MATTVSSVEFRSEITITEQLPSTSMPSVAASRRTIVHNAFNDSKSFTGSTSPAVTKIAAFNLTLSGGAATIDLTSLTDSNGDALDATGLKVQSAKFKNKGTNSGTMAVTEGAANGYALGGASFSWILQPGQSITIDGNDASPDVATADATIDVAGTGTEQLEVTLAFG